MKQSYIRPCIGCGKGVMHDNCIAFYRVSIDRMVANLAAIQKQAGLEMMIGGNARIAMAMGPDDDIAKVFAQHVVLVCLECSMRPLASLLERMYAADEATSAGGTS